ncbi:MAG: xanthine dehydrogenase family protein molybdopterin-binding subunit, partial [Deltaproteobacteria bacterium]|nr:xanthine dehydrogenase family protein molybdopterin-binding subunit [Deltaproteobacteria bacterium]
MARRLTLKLGYARDVQDVTVVVPDDEPAPWQFDERFALVGVDTPRLDGVLKATGNARYTYDLELPGMLYGAILRSPYPHARVGKIDLAGALQMSGVRAAIARADQVVRFAGQEVAAVAAITPELAMDALGAIRVDYQPLPFVASMQDALKGSAPRVFASGSNASAAKVFHTGNVENGFRQAAAIHEAVYTTPVQAHVSLETHGAVASWDRDKLTVWVSTQGIFTVRDDLMVFFALPPENVRVITTYLGGGFGSKFGAGAEVVMAAQLAREAGAPVKLMLPRAAEHLATGNRPSSWQHVKVAAASDAKLTAIDLFQHGSGGIGGGAGSSGPFKQVYNCPNVRTEERNVYLNAGPSSPMRAPGWPQGCFALELALDELAHRLGIDRLEFRRRNSTHPVRALEYEIGSRAFEWQERSRASRNKGPVHRGIGVASGWWHGTGRPGSQAEMVARRDGRVELRTGSQDIGTGTRTILAMTAAEELGIPLSQVGVEIGDTRYLYAVPSGGSSTAPSTTPAVRQAAAHLKEKLFRLAAP